MNKKEVIEKIKKCLALGKSANEHEAALESIHLAKSMDEVRQILGLNPRFDGAFLNLQLQYKYVKDYLS